MRCLYARQDVMHVRKLDAVCGLLIGSFILNLGIFLDDGPVHLPVSLIIERYSESWGKLVVACIALAAIGTMVACWSVILGQYLISAGFAFLAFPFFSVFEKGITISLPVFAKTSGFAIAIISIGLLVSCFTLFRKPKVSE